MKKVLKTMHALRASAVRAFVNNTVQKSTLIIIVIICDDFWSQLRNFRPIFQSQNPGIRRPAILGFRD